MDHIKRVTDEFARQAQTFDAWAEKTDAVVADRFRTVGQQRRNYVGGGISEAAPIGAELERHDDTGDDPHAEGNTEDPGPEPRYAKPDLPARKEIKPLKNRNVGGKPDGEGRQ